MDQWGREMRRKRYGPEQVGMLGFFKNPKKHDSSNNQEKSRKGYHIPY
jgi:hypothetical protein